MQTYYQMPLDELCAVVIENIWAFIDSFPAHEVSADALELGTLRRTLEELSAYGGLSRKGDTDFDILSAILQRELDRETLGWFTVFDGVVDPEIGAVGNTRDVRELTERGWSIDHCVRSLGHIAYIRSICRARLDAEKLLMRG
jgi:hypothetical protein